MRNIFWYRFPAYKKALCKEFGVHNCVARFNRINRTIGAKEETSTLKRKLSPTEGKVRSRISWLSITSSVVANTTQSRFALTVYQKKNETDVPNARIDVLRRRAKSMFENRSNGNVDHPSDTNEMKDQTSGQQAKFNSPNFGLKTSSEGVLEQVSREAITDFEESLNEPKERIQSKSEKK